MLNTQEYFLRRLDRPKIVCLCGSAQFWGTFQTEGLRLALEGKLVLSIEGNFSEAAALRHPNTPEGKAQKSMLDELHKRKIDLADEVFFLNVGGYMGDSTKSELAYALMIGKPVMFLEPVCQS